MSNRYVKINGVDYNPSEVDDDTSKIGESRRMGDGTLRYYHRANKAKLTFKWNNIRETFVSALRTIAMANTTYTVIDYDGNTYTMIILPGSWKRSIAADQVDSLGVKRYNIEITFEEV